MPQGVEKKWLKDQNRQYINEETGSHLSQTKKALYLLISCHFSFLHLPCFQNLAAKPTETIPCSPKMVCSKKQ